MLSPGEIIFFVKLEAFHIFLAGGLTSKSFFPPGVMDFFWHILLLEPSGVLRNGV